MKLSHPYSKACDCDHCRAKRGEDPCQCDICAEKRRLGMMYGAPKLKSIYVNSQGKKGRPEHYRFKFKSERWKWFLDALIPDETAFTTNLCLYSICVAIVGEEVTKDRMCKYLAHVAKFTRGKVHQQRGFRVRVKVVSSRDGGWSLKQKKKGEKENETR